MRIDKFLWSVRIAKTRTKAADMCKNGRVKVLDEQVKPARDIAINDEIFIRHKPHWRSYVVLGLPTSRLGAKLVSEYVKEVTPAHILEEIEFVERQNRMNRASGIFGRPTKRDRRRLDKMNDG